MIESENTRKSIFDALAVALRYKPEEGDAAPRVVAGGRGYRAQRLIEIAEENGIPIHKNEALVKLLSAVEIETEIPLALYAAVAEILALIYRADKELQKEILGG